jgi:tripartite-type tricarboxylate transporter receptor subunit TctC
MVVGFEPGGGTDTVARVVAKFLGDNIGQQVLVENRAGAGGNIAVDYVIKSPPDGYTIVLANVGSLTVNPHLMKLAYDPMRDLAPVTMAVVFPNIIVTNPARMPAKNLAEFVKIAKQKPNTVTFGSSGVGGAGHLAGALLEEVAHIDLVHVPYKGGGPAMRGLLGGEVDCYISTPVAALPHIKAGKVLAIASTGAKRSTALPDVPTFTELGVTGVEAMGWFGFFAPPKTPKPIVDALNKAINTALQSPDVAAKLSGLGMDPATGTPEQFGKIVADDYAKWGPIVKASGFKPD